jgi:threonine dehydratase
MSSKYRRPLYVNYSASSWTTTSSTADGEDISKFHNGLPNFAPTNLISLDTVAEEVGVKAVYLKDESNQCAGRAFRILGASWAAFKAIAVKTGFGTDARLEEVCAAARDADITLLAATAGNHGTAVASIAKSFGIGSKIYVPHVMDETTRDSIRSEGAEVIVVQGSYDEAVIAAQGAAVEMRTSSYRIQLLMVTRRFHR